MESIVLADRVDAVTVTSGTSSAARARTITPVESQSLRRRRRRGCGSACGRPSSGSQRSPSQNMTRSSFGNPADSGSPVALRPRLATGVPFRGCVAQRSRPPLRQYRRRQVCRHIGRWSRGAAAPGSRSPPFNAPEVTTIRRHLTGRRPGLQRSGVSPGRLSSPFLRDPSATSADFDRT